MWMFLPHYVEFVEKVENGNREKLPIFSLFSPISPIFEGMAAHNDENDDDEWWNRRHCNGGGDHDRLSVKWICDALTITMWCFVPSTKSV